MYSRYPPIILDACCVLNLYASSQLSNILAAFSTRFVMVSVVFEDELLSLPPLASDKEGTAVDLESVIDEGLLSIVAFESEAELETFVNIAATLGDDGESATIALAIHRKWTVATDDKKALSYLAQHAANIQTVTTPDLIKHWVEFSKPAPEILREALRSIRINGHYEPSRRHPLYEWWQQSSA